MRQYSGKNRASCRFQPILLYSSSITGSSHSSMLFTYIAMTLIAQNQNTAAFSSGREDCSCIKCEFQCDIRNGSECISSGNAWRSKKTIRVAASAEGDRCIRPVGFSALRRPVPGGIEGSENAEADRPLWSVYIRSDSVGNSPMVICKS